MTPLQVFYQSLKPLIQRPFAFLLSSEQKEMVSKIKSAIEKLKKDLVDKKLEKTKAYQILQNMEESLLEMQHKEANFFKELDQLFDVYREAPSDEKFKQELDKIDLELSQARKEIIEYHASLKNLNKKAEALSEEEKNKSDLKIIQEIGVFYVLEYTLRVFYDFQFLSNEDKLKLIKQGLQTSGGNLPAFYPAVDSLRNELCYKIYDKRLRDTLLKAFYDLEKTFLSEKVENFNSALKEFNLIYLKAFQEKGLPTYQAKIYAPFGNNISITELINTINNIH